MRDNESVFRPGRLAMLIAGACLAAVGCGALNGEGPGNGPECNRPRTGVQTIEEHNRLPLCEGERVDPVSVPSTAHNDEIIAWVKGFGTEPGVNPRTFDDAVMSVCASLTSDAAPSEIVPFAAQWFGEGEDLLTWSEARSVIDLIETQGWCLT